MMNTFLTAEIGSNWEGDISKAKLLIKECKLAGADAVKFQMWRAKDLYENHKLFRTIKKSELTFKKAKILHSYSKKIGINFFCSVFYPEAVDFLETLDVKYYKIASRTCIFRDPWSTETLDAVNKTRKQSFVSMGMGGNRKLIENLLSKTNPIFCYCVSKYPLKIEHINWKKAKSFAGFSDHTLGITAPLIYSNLIKPKKFPFTFIEKHVKLKNSKSLDASTSITTDELAILQNCLNDLKKFNI